MTGLKKLSKIAGSRSTSSLDGKGSLPSFKPPGEKWWAKMEPGAVANSVPRRKRKVAGGVMKRTETTSPDQDGDDGLSRAGDSARGRLLLRSSFCNIEESLQLRARGQG
jgi:hypothetical protein